MQLAYRRTRPEREKGEAQGMARYITLINFTEQGIKTIKDWDKRISATRERLDRAGGGKLIDVSLTLGEFDRVADFKAGLNKLRTYEMAEVGPVDGKELLHLQCHFGLDTLCWARLGARVTGIDFSAAAISQARALAQEVGLDARFVQSDIYELPQHLEGGFDVVYTSRGVLGWLPDIERWGRAAAHCVSPGGFFY